MPPSHGWLMRVLIKESLGWLAEIDAQRVGARGRRGNTYAFRGVNP
jgi:hypothetical protein